MFQVTCKPKQYFPKVELFLKDKLCTGNPGSGRVWFQASPIWLTLGFGNGSLIRLENFPLEMACVSLQSEGRTGQQQMLLNTSDISFPSGLETCLFISDSREQLNFFLPSLPFSRNGSRFCVPVGSSGPPKSRAHRVSPADQWGSQCHTWVSVFFTGGLFIGPYASGTALFQTPVLLRLHVLRSGGVPGQTWKKDDQAGVTALNTSAVYYCYKCIAPVVPSPLCWFRQQGPIIWLFTLFTSPTPFL